MAKFKKFLTTLIALGMIGSMVAVPAMSYKEYQDYLQELEANKNPQPGEEDDKKAKPVLQSIEATLVEGKQYFANNLADPKAEDFIVKANFTLEGSEPYSETLKPDQYSLSVPADFVFNGGDITVSYRTKSVTVSVALVAVELESLEITDMPYTIYYPVGGVFDETGLQVKAVYNDGEEKVLASDKYTVTGDSFDSVGEKTMTVTYAEGGVTKSATFKVTVSETIEDGNVVSLMSNGGVVQNGAMLSGAELSLYAIYESGNRKLLQPGEYTILSEDKKAEMGKMYTISVAYAADTSKTVQIPVAVRQHFEGETGKITGANVRQSKTEAEYVFENGQLVATGNNVTFVGNFSKDASNGVESSVAYALESASSTLASITMRCGNSYLARENDAYIMKPLQINTILDIIVNGKPVAIPDSVVLKGCGPASVDDGYAPLYGVYYTFTMEDIPLTAGNNEIKFSFKMSTVGAKNCWNESPSSMNIDWIQVDSMGAEISADAKIESIELGANFTLDFGSDINNIEVPVLGTLDDGTVMKLDKEFYDVKIEGNTNANGQLLVGAATLTVTLKSDPSVKLTQEFEIKPLRLEAEQATLAGSRVVSSTEIEYKWMQDEDGYGEYVSMGNIGVVKGMDFGSTPKNGGLASMTYTFNAVSGRYNLWARVDNAYYFSNGTNPAGSEYTLDLDLSQVLLITVNGTPIPVKAVTLPGVPGATNADYLWSTYYEVIIADIQLKDGENVVVISGNSETGLRNRWGEVPVPRFDWIELDSVEADACYLEQVPGKSATCLEAGYETYYQCTDCGKMYSDPEGKNEISAPVTLPVIAHNWVEASCTEAKSCTMCHTSEGEALGHDMLLRHDADGHWYECSRCDEVSQKQAHTGGTATCDTRAICEVCGEEYGKASHGTVTKIEYNGDPLKVVIGGSVSGIQGTVSVSYDCGHTEECGEDSNKVSFAYPGDQAVFGKAYSVVVTSVENPAITLEIPVTIERVLQGEDATIAGGKKNAEAEYTIVDGVYVKGANNSFAGGFANAVKNGNPSYVEFDLVAYAEGTVDLTLRCANSNLRHDANGYYMAPLQINTILDMTVNGKAVAIPDDVVLAGTEEARASSYAPAYNVYKTFTFEDVAVKAGKNVIRLAFKKSTTGETNHWNESPSEMNIDWISITSQGTLVEGNITGLIIDSANANALTAVVLADYNGTQAVIEESEYDLSYVINNDYTVTFTATLKADPSVTASYTTTEMHEETLQAVLDNGFVATGEYSKTIVWGDKNLECSGGKASGDADAPAGAIGGMDAKGRYLTYKFYIEKDGVFDLDWYVAGSYWNGSTNAGIANLGACISWTLDSNYTISTEGIELKAGAGSESLWWNLQHVVVKGVQLKAGQHEMTILNINKAYPNVGSMTISGNVAIQDWNVATITYQGELNNDYTTAYANSITLNANSEAGFAQAGGVVKADPAGGLGNMDNPGDWVEYTFTLAEDGKVDFDWYVAANRYVGGSNLGTENLGSALTYVIDGSITVSLEGVALMPDSSTNWWYLQHIVAEGISLSAGTHTIRITCITGFPNVGSMTISSDVVITAGV